MKGIKLVPNKPLTETQKLKLENKMLRQEVASLKKKLKLYSVVKSFYCLNESVYGKSSKCVEQCLACALPKQQ